MLVKATETNKASGIPVKLAIYIRTTSEDVDYLHREYLDIYKDYNIVQFYLDNKTGKQPAFKELISDAKKNLFEVVVTKSILNFTSTQDVTNVMRTLRTMKHPIAIYFEDENLFSFDIEEQYRKKLRERFFRNIQVVKENEHWRSQIVKGRD